MNEKNMSLRECYLVSAIIITSIVALIISCVLSLLFEHRTENYKLIKTEQIYNIREKTTPVFIIDTIKKCSKDKHGKTCYSYYIFYTKQDNQKRYIELELPTNKTQIINNSRTVASINTCRDCQFFICDYKYEINLPVKKKPIFV